MNRAILFILLCFLPIILSAQPAKVEVKQGKNGYSLYRNGEPYYIKGAGGIQYFEKLKEYGGNSIRLWTTENAKEFLDKAHSLGLTVTLGIYLKPERDGFDYSNKAEVKKQMDYIRSEVMRYKDHPALLVWGIGNELELFAKNPKVWDAINDVAAMIKEIDPNHPVTTMVASVPEKHMSHIIQRCKNLDFLSVNAFKDLPNIQAKLIQHGWSKPYLISEWGSDGYWETTPTKWNSFIEESSTVKAEQYRVRYEKIIKANNDRCLGSYVFFWGQKQERSHTFFSMFLDKGQETEAVDVMQYLWTGKWPQHRAPKIKDVLLNNKVAKDNIYIKPGSENLALVKMHDDGDLVYYWELLPEGNDLRPDGQGETKPPVINTAFADPFKSSVTFRAPEKPGAYRLFIHVYTKTNKVATANIPFYVKP
jgi:beta-galactosidase/beta-glucuronidase